MKPTTVLMLLAASVIATSTAHAASVAEVKWINQCIQDNKNEGVKDDVVVKYCTCMNNQMDANETQSISTWEKSHETEADMCVKRSGWK